MSKCKISYEEHNQGGVSIKIEGKNHRCDSWSVVSH